MVPLRGFAPRSPLYKSGSLLLAYRGVNFGGADETQTHDPLNANQVLYQLSYNPKKLWQRYSDSNRDSRLERAVS